MKISKHNLALGYVVFGALVFVVALGAFQVHTYGDAPLEGLLLSTFFEFFGEFIVYFYVGFGIIGAISLSRSK